MAAAFDLVPGVPPDRRPRNAVVTIAGALDDCVGLFDHAFVDHVRGNLILDAGPDFVGIEHDVAGPAPLRPSDDQEPLVAVAGNARGDWRKPVMSGSQLYLKIERRAVCTLSLGKM